MLASQNYIHRKSTGERAFRNDLRSIKEGVGQLKEEIGRLGRGDEIDLLKSNNGKVGIEVEALDSRLERLDLENVVKSRLNELGDPRSQRGLTLRYLGFKRRCWSYPFLFRL